MAREVLNSYVMNAKKISPAQSRFLAAVDAAGPAGYMSPSTAGRNTVAAVSAWHRTAAACKRNGWVVITNNGSRYTARRATR